MQWRPALLLKCCLSCVANVFICQSDLRTVIGRFSTLMCATTFLDLSHKLLKNTRSKNVLVAIFETKYLYRHYLLLFMNNGNC